MCRGRRLKGNSRADRSDDLSATRGASLLFVLSTGV
jgi:hypothetical protein